MVLSDTAQTYIIFGNALVCTGGGKISGYASDLAYLTNLPSDVTSNSVSPKNRRKITAYRES